MPRVDRGDFLPEKSTGPGNSHWFVRIWQLTWPIMLANATLPLTGLADIAMMGRLPDPAYTGAVAVGAQAMSALFWLFGFLRMATTGLVAQDYGASSAHAIRQTLRRGWAFAMVGSVLLLALQGPLLLAVSALFAASERVELFSVNYLSIRLWGAPALLANLVLTGALIGLQRTRQALLVSLVQNGLNIALNLFFVLGLEMAISGVAIASVLAEWTAAAIAALCVRFALKDMPADTTSHRTRSLSAFLDISGNLVVRAFFVQLPFFLVTWTSAGLGDTTLAANAILMQLFLFTTYTTDAFAHTAEALCGHAAGRRDRAGILRISRQTLIAALSFAAPFGVLYLLATPFLAGLLSANDAVVEAVTACRVWMALLPFVAVWAFVYDGVYIGLTAVRPLRNTMLVAALLFCVCLVMFLPWLHNHGLWLSFLLFMLVRGIILGARQVATVNRLTL
ncbi:MAG: MATE family efflux transporter [Pseudomonadales bacterium]|nr:MATE family efflux transporter [Pseudomonadales bacterium]